LGYVATQLELKLVEQAGEVRGRVIDLDSSAIDRELAELREEGWELGSTGLRITKLSSPLTPAYAFRVTYALRKPVAATTATTKDRASANLLRLRDRFPK
jgi:hypothetical protein